MLIVRKDHEALISHLKINGKISDPDNFINANPIVTPIHTQPEYFEIHF